MHRVLIIGSEGFIGSAVTRILRQGYHVQRADILLGVDAEDYHRIDPEQPDLVSLLETTKPDVVINCSGAASVPLSFENPVRDFQLNTVRIADMLEAIRTSLPDTRFIHLSSAAVYGNPQSLPVLEAAPTSPVSPYGWNKLYAEQICREYASLFDLKTISLRVFSCYGPGLRKQLFWDVYQKTKQNSAPSFFGSGEEARDFIYVDDLAYAISVLIEKATFDGRAINAASGQMTTIRDAVEILLGHLEARCYANFTGKARRGDPDRWLADISYLEGIGFKSTIDIETGLERTAKWLDALD